MTGNDDALPMPRENVLVVDDDDMVRDIARDVLEDAGFRVTTAAGVAEAQGVLQSGGVDLVVSDIRMPVATGIDLLRWCRTTKRNVPFILMSAYADATLIVDALNLGADSFLSKPFTNDALVAQAREKLAARRLARIQARFADHLDGANRMLEQTVRTRTAELQMAAEELKLSQDVTIVSLASLAEARDPETGMHIERTRSYVRRLAEHLAGQGPASHRLEERAIDLLYRTAPLHDIGKVGTPDAILLKPGKLTPEEFEVMKKHTTYGGDALARAASRLQPGSFLEQAATIAYQHHERWDGKGYPAGLAGELIALPARLMAVADVYDALVSRRPYKEPMPHEKACAIIEAGRGSQFDAVVVDAFVALSGTFADIARQLAD
jgi:putative two-component system response regulator